MAHSTYYIQYLITTDSDFRSRVAACANEEATRAGVNIGAPEQWATEHRWEVMGPDWDEKVAYALETDPEAKWGADPTVITDGDLLAVVQPLITALVPGGG